MKRVCDLTPPYFYYMSFCATVYHCNRSTPHETPCSKIPTDPDNDCQALKTLLILKYP